MQMTLVSLNKSRPAPVAVLSSPRWTEGALECFHPHALPHPPRLRGPGSTPSFKVEPGPALAAVAPPASAVVGLPDLATQVGSDRYVAGKELVVAAE